MKAAQRHIQSGGVVFVQSKVLLRKTPSGHWIFPKGHVEEGESFPQTAEREILEETGVRAESERYLGSVRYRMGDDRYEVRLYSMTYLKTTKAWRKHDGVDAFLVAAEDAARLLSFDDYRRILAMALRRGRVPLRRGRAPLRRRAGVKSGRPKRKTS